MRFLSIAGILALLAGQLMVSQPNPVQVTVALPAGTNVIGHVISDTGSVATIPGNGTVLSGQQAVTASAAALATNTSKNICVEALVGNTINVYLGASGVTTSTGLELPPGAASCWPVTNTNLVYVIASTTGASVSWFATN